MKRRIRHLLVIGMVGLSNNLLYPISEHICDQQTEAQKSTEDESVYLGDFLQPWDLGDPNELVELDFEDTELSSFISYIAERYQLTFILDDALKPEPKNGRSALGVKISFRTHEPLSKKNAWAIFLTFLDMAGLAIAPGPTPKVYRITTSDPKSPMSVLKNPLPTFMGVNPTLLPNNDTRIRYVYFVQDASLDIIKNVLDTMKSATAGPLIIFPEVRGIVITDKSYNIKAMLEIVNELDKVTMPETMSIIKLKKTDALKVAKLYKDIAQTGKNDGLASRLLGRQGQTLSYFDPGTRVIPEPRTNTLILLGTEESIKKIEKFILTEIDKDIEMPYSPMHVYTLKHVQAEAVADILNKAVKFQSQSEAAKAGGVRDGNKYLKPLSIIPEKSGNRLIITADYDDYIKIHETLEKIDVEQPQVAVKVLIINIDLTDTKELGVQLRNKKPGVNGLLSNNVNFQTSGMEGARSVVENSRGTGAVRLLGDLINLATNGTVGSNYLTLGSDCFGVWGMFRILQRYTQANVVSNPFLVTANNYPAEISLGEERRVLTGQTTGAGGQVTNSYGDLKAKLTVAITPQISYEGFITLEVVVEDDQFTSTAESSGDRTEKEIRTSVIMANNEVLALGGLVKDSYSDTESKVPVLGDIPGVGWLFKNKQRTKTRSSLLVLISPEIIPVNDDTISNELTASQIKDAEGTMSANNTRAVQIDPIHRWFFKETSDAGTEMIDSFVSKEERYLHPTQKKKRDASPRKRLSDFL